MSSINASGRVAVPVEAIRADSEISKLPQKPDLIKMDVEGAEVLALRGMSETLRKRPTLILERDESRLAGMGFRPEELDALLGEFTLSKFGRCTLLAEPIA